MMAFYPDRCVDGKHSGFHLGLFGCILFSLLFFTLPAAAQEKLLVFAGAASKPPTEEAAALYEKKTGVKVEVVFGGSGYVLSQMKLSRQGDVYFPGSSDYMELAKREGSVFSETERRRRLSGQRHQCAKGQSP
jgi:molybdate transport system substrate-binding protein